MISTMPTKQRAEPLAPEERRKSIVEAVTPLLLERGSRVTTAEMAQAAGIAEGTIFRVFPDKAALIRAAMEASFDPAPELEGLARIERDLPFEIKLRKVATILLNRAERVHALAAVLRSLPHQSHRHMSQAHGRAMKANSVLFRGLTELFDEEADTLAVEPARAAAALRGLLYSVNFPLNDPSECLSPDDAIAILLKGVLREDCR
jgi:AcrR family transcriptional regulator